MDADMSEQLHDGKNLGMRMTCFMSDGPLLPHPMITWIKFLVLCYDLKAYFCLPHSLDLFYSVWLMIQWQAIPIVANNLSRNFFILFIK